MKRSLIFLFYSYMKFFLFYRYVQRISDISPGYIRDIFLKKLVFLPIMCYFNKDNAILVKLPVANAEKADFF